MTVSKTELASISTPDRVESRLGTLEFLDGAPTPDTSEVLYDNLDFMHRGRGVHEQRPGGVGRGLASGGS